MVQEPTSPAADAEGWDGPRSIGPFRLLEPIGAGGMGVVYLAERREPVEQRVALKVIRTDRLDRTYRARFAMEQQALARMDHPNIARLLDAGVADGQSWFAMEYVPGQPLDDYCREHRLSLEQRLRLFVQVCDAVQHAHIKGILHRDLKPANVLVREVDGRPVAKIIDFGLAQPVDPLQIRATLHEAVKQVVGTIAYMSPEQAERTEGDLDTRTDVYSLGAVLYELLTGEVPLDVDDVQRRGLAWFGTFLREHEPPRPSTRLSSLGERLSTTAAERGTTPQRLRSAVRGDLDWVTMKALARDRQHRYPTVRDLGREIERVLAHRPVEAGPPSAWYVARKWVRRHAVGVAVGSLVVTAAVAITAVSETMSRRARAAEVRRDLVSRGLLAVEHLRCAEEDLWPADGTRVAEMTAWLEELPAVVGIAAELRAYELELEAAVGEGSAIKAQLDFVRRGCRAISDLAAMRDRVVARRERASTLEQRTIDAHESAWRAAEAGLAADVRFAGFRLERREGLVPLGRNERTGLQEFYLLDSAADSVLPERRFDQGFDVGPRTGIMLVLVPGTAGSLPTATEPIAPFLLARYELTQAQWARLCSEGVDDAPGLFCRNPSNQPAGLQRLAFGAGEPSADHDQVSWDATMWTHPVQQVSWLLATTVLARWSLRLPAPGEWQRAAMAGSADFGWVRAEPRAFANLREGVSAADQDGFQFSSPVGALAANPFGFHDILGNVAELLLDGYDEHAPPGLAVAAMRSGRAVYIGQHFTTPTLPDDLTTRRQTPIGNIHEFVGVRPVFLLR